MFISIKLFRSFFILLSSCLLFAFITPQLHRLYEMRMHLSFATTPSDFEVYIFTDFSDPKSVLLEPKIEQLAPEILKQARLYLIDIPSEKTKDLRIANITFMLDKTKPIEHYFKVRNALLQLATKNPSSNSEEIKQSLKQLEIAYTPLSQELIDPALTTTAMMNKNFKIQNKPTMILYNKKTKKKKVFDNLDAMNVTTFLSEINQLQNSSEPPLVDSQK